MLTYNGVSYNNGNVTVDPGTYQSTTGTGSNSTSTFNSNDSSKGGFDWNALLSILPGLANGTANIIAASKSGQPVYYSNLPQYQQSNYSINWLWILLLVGLAIGLYFAFSRGGKKAKG